MTDPQEANRRAAERAHDEGMKLRHKLMEGAMRDAQAAIRIVLVINGSAAIAVLTFLGNFAVKNDFPRSPQLSRVISNSQWFVWGVACSAAAAVFAYAANSFYAARLCKIERTYEPPYIQPTKASKYYECLAEICHISGIIFAIVGVGLSVYGLYKLRSAVGHLI